MRSCVCVPVVRPRPVSFSNYKRTASEHFLADSKLRKQWLWNLSWRVWPETMFLKLRAGKLKCASWGVLTFSPKTHMLFRFSLVWGFSDLRNQDSEDSQTSQNTEKQMSTYENPVLFNEQPILLGETSRSSFKHTKTTYEHTMYATSVNGILCVSVSCGW